MTLYLKFTRYYVLTMPDGEELDLVPALHGVANMPLRPIETERTYAALADTARRTADEVGGTLREMTPAEVRDAALKLQIAKRELRVATGLD